MKKVKITIIADLDKDLIELMKEQGMTDKEIVSQVKLQVKHNPLNEIPMIHDFEIKEIEIL